ncbi:multicopper oxidase domain-containing protein [Ornithinimicrobium sp. F0845]|uniref:multicopper oxidase family protein n=1 Tax=Ornithinimicrobium sp. F0845 TaxID=2926412 RepID=UPI001FF3ACBB|nr:multicopper oxidase domain-containing protein [Ornithinimicrobium sp. F0845]MCK0112383.1 multicopper oxidase domain-containing protein [Ornithinimicrobium sp. F0845]
MSRRRNRSVLSVFARVVAVGVGGVILLVAGLVVGAWMLLAPTDTVGEVDFDTELAIPPLAESTIDDQGRRVFDLTAQEGSLDLSEGEVQTWGFNGDYLGPTLRAERGEEVLVRYRNELPDASTVHWHGMHLPAAMDGGPHQLVESGGTWEPTWTIDQPAATLWYHPHPHGETMDHVSRGLAGMFILADPAQTVDLPSEYGVDDLPIIVTDPSSSRGEVQTNSEFGDRLLVNGTEGPYAEVSTELVRLRLLNGSPMRVYSFQLDDGSPLVQVASDGGLLPAPHETTSVRLSPGERAEVLVRMEPGETRTLRSIAPDLGQNFLSERFGGGEDRFDVLQLRAADQLADSPDVPEELAPDIVEHAGDPDAVDRTREFRMSGRQINGAQMRMDHADEVVTLGDTEVWEVTNTGGEVHTFHVHDVQFRVLSVDGREPPPELSGLKDTILVEDGVDYRLLMTFTDYADPTMPYMYHCHLLRHEDQGMMGQFVVVEEGQEPAIAARQGNGHH